MMDKHHTKISVHVALLAKGNIKAMCKPRNELVFHFRWINRTATGQETDGKESVFVLFVQYFGHY